MLFPSCFRLPKDCNISTAIKSFTGTSNSKMYYYYDFLGSDRSKWEIENLWFRVFDSFETSHNHKIKHIGHIIEHWEKHDPFLPQPWTIWPLFKFRYWGKSWHLGPRLHYVHVVFPETTFWGKTSRHE